MPVKYSKMKYKAISNLFCNYIFVCLTKGKKNCIGIERYREINNYAETSLMNFHALLQKSFYKAILKNHLTPADMKLLL